MGNIVTMKTISVPIGEARTNLCGLVEQVKASGLRVLLTSYGQPKAQLLPCSENSVPWRTETPDDPKRYGDLSAPVMEDWA